MTEPQRAVDPTTWADDPASPGSPDSVADSPASRRVPQLWRSLVAYAVLCLVVGALSGVLWNWIVDLPSYEVHDDGSATITERAITEVFSADAHFSLIGVLVGLLVGWLGWKWFSRLGWPVSLVVMVGSLLAAVVCWQVGEAIGPGEFAARVSSAQSGDRVPIAFELTSPSAFFVWMMAALAPVLLWSSLGREDVAVPESPEDAQQV
ncbi:MAG TPA: hypothetical protein VLR88_06095 [Propionibacteriaceae bacterium]|nr:hypothetical protein [Propionibacteriaceae bacterium]